MSDEIRIPRDPAVRDRLANFAGLTDDERAAIDQLASGLCGAGAV